MTDGHDTGAANRQGSRRARVETDHGDHETARRLARALRPDNTAEMDTRVEGSRVVTTIARETTGGLQSNADDYLVNLQVGARLATRDHGHAETRDHDHDRAETPEHDNEDGHDRDHAETRERDSEDEHDHDHAETRNHDSEDGHEHDNGDRQ